MKRIVALAVFAAALSLSAQIPFGPIVGRLHAVLEQKPEEMAPILLSPHAVQQSLIVIVAQNPVSSPYETSDGQHFLVRVPVMPATRPFNFVDNWSRLLTR